MHPEDRALDLSPEEFELEVKTQLESVGKGLPQFDVKHRELVPAPDGEYEIDIVVRYSALGVNFAVLVECKRHKNPIKREVVQALNDRLQSTGAQKGMIYSTNGFQRGAIEYAKMHGIALVRLVDGKSTYVTKALGPRSEPPPWANCPKFSGWLVSLTEEGHEQRCRIALDHLEYLREFLDRKAPGEAS